MTKETKPKDSKKSTAAKKSLPWAIRRQKFQKKAPKEVSYELTYNLRSILRGT